MKFMAKKSKKNASKKPKTPSSAKASKGKKFPEKIIKYLENAGIPHEVLEHKTVYTAMDAAATMRKKLGEIAKSLLVKADRDYFLIILPADRNLDFGKLAKALKSLNKKDYTVVKIPGEKIMTELLKLKQGTISAFGKLHNLPVIAEKNLTKVKKAVFPTGDFNHSVQMAVKDFIKLENALLGSFGVKKKIKLPKVVKKIKKPAKGKGKRK